MIRKLLVVLALMFGALTVAPGAHAGREFSGTTGCGPFQRVTVDVLAYGNVNVVIGSNAYARGYIGAPLQWYRVRGASSFANWGAWYPEDARGYCS